MSMTTRASARIKRSSYVSKNTENSADCSTSNGDFGGEPSRKKVRKELSVCETQKDSEYFTRNGDHIYSKENGEEDVRMSDSLKCNRLPRLYLTKSAAFTRSESEDPDTINFDDEENISILPGKRQRCFSKNAVNARLNRERKKLYISSLENIKDSLLKENQEMNQKVKNQEKVIAALQCEVKYLKSMLANSKEISEILKSLTKSTGLPVTSSLQSLATINNDAKESNDADAFQGNGNDQLKTHSNMRQAFHKKVTSGANFPIMQKDVNLGYSDSYDEDELLKQGFIEMDPSFSPVSDLSWDNAFLSECNLDLNFSMFDHSFDPVFSSESENIKENEPVANTAFQDINKNESNVGLCIHVNNKKISVELCSLCNARAQIK